METPYISKIYKYIHIFKEKIEFCSRFYVYVQLFSKTRFIFVASSIVLNRFVSE